MHTSVFANALVTGEVFLDDSATTPGTGTAFILDNSGDVFSAASAAINLTGVSPGIHTLYMRFKDDQNEWSSPLGITFYVTEGNPVSPFSGGENVLIAAEAFVDTDPGEGNGVPLDVAADGVIDSSIEKLSGVLQLNNLSIGPHVVHTRVLDRTGIWSLLTRQTFYIADTIIPGTTGQVELEAAEGIIDDGSAIVLPADDGSFNETTETASLNASVGSGYHSAQIRFQDTQGLWSKLVANDCVGNGLISGKLVDATTGQVLAGTTITIGASTVVTDLDGYYKIENLTCTQHQISVDAGGFENYSRTYDLSDGWWNVIRLTKAGTTLGTKSDSALYGDPVNTATGNYVYDRRDIEFPGIGMSLQFDRTYNSKAASEAAAIGVPMGYGWSHSFDASLVVDGGEDVTITWGDGRTQTWVPDGMGAFTSQYGVFDELIDNGNGAYTLLKRNLTRYHFDVSGRLSSIEDKNSNTISLTYISGDLTQITDTAGRIIVLDYDNSNRLTQITDPINRTIQFAYDLNGDLVTATDLGGYVTTYTYDSSHQVLSVVDPRGNTIVNNTYDAANRVVTYQTDAKGGATSYSYQMLDRVTTITDALNNAITHHHDELLRLIREVDALGHETLYEYDTSGNRSKITDKNGNLTEYAYDANGNVTTKTDALGQGTTITYDAQNNPLTRSDALGNVTQFLYDAKGNLTQTTDALGNIATVTYSANGLPLTLTDALSNVTTHTYDAEGNRNQTTDALTNNNTHTYDGVGRRLSSTDLLSRTTTYTFDGNDNLLTVTDPLLNTVTHTYDGNNNRLSTLDKNGNLTNFSYDEKDLLTTTTDALGNVVSNTYDSMNRRISVTDANGNVTQAVYDAVGNQTQVIDALANITQYTFDPSGSRLTSTNARGNTTSTKYDALNRRTKITDPLGEITTTTYDALGRVDTITSTAGQLTTNTYDALGRLIQVVNAMGGITQHSYDANGNRITTTDPRGNVTTFGHDALDRGVMITDALGKTATTVYDAAGQVASVTDKRGNTTTSTYDVAGRLIQVSDPLDETTLSTYDANGNRLTVTDKLGRIISTTYDVLDRVVSLTDAAGDNSTIAYDAVSNKVSETNRNGNTTQFVYDVLNRQVQVTNALGNSTQVVYDEVGNQISITNPLGNTTTYSYDSNNRRTTESDPLGNTNTTLYDEVGRVTSSTDANGQVTAFAYDLLNRLTQVTDAQGGLVTYAYDENGNRLSMNDPNGNVTSNVYDVLNRQTVTTEALGNITTVQYDEVGNVTQRTDARGEVTQFVYDPLNRLVTTTYPDPKVVTLTYDAVGNRIQMTDSLGTTNTTYDTRNRVTQVTDPFGNNVQYGYDANGNRTSLTYPGNKIVSYTFDAENRMTTVVDWLAHTTSYNYDAADRLSFTNQPNGTLVSYSYDAANRMTNLYNLKSNFSAISSYVYTLDGVGNHLSEDRVEPISPSIPAVAQLHTYDVENRLTDTNTITNTFDDNGNLTAKGANSYNYDEENRLTQTTIGTATTQYTYDGLSNRYSRTRSGTTTRFVLDTNTALTNVLAETDDAGTVQVYNIYGLGLISRIQSDNTTHYYHYDTRGSTIALTDTSENITDSYTYDLFGKTAASAGTNTNPYRYLGRHGVLDEGDDLNYIRARYYDTEQQRFVSKDSYLGENGQSQTLNRYAYGLNNPIRLIDVSGFSASEVVEPTLSMDGPSNSTPFNEILISSSIIDAANIATLSELLTNHASSTNNVNESTFPLLDAYSILLSDSGLLLDLLEKLPLELAKIRPQYTSIQPMVTASNFTRSTMKYLGILGSTADMSIYLRKEITSDLNIDSLEAIQLMTGEMAAAPINAITATGRGISSALINHELKDDYARRDRMLEIVEEFRLDGREVTEFFDTHVDGRFGGDFLYNKLGIYNPDYNPVNDFFD